MKTLFAKHSSTLFASFLSLVAYCNLDTPSAMAQFKLSFPTESQISDSVVVDNPSTALSGTWVGELRSGNGILRAQLSLLNDGQYRGSVMSSVTQFGETRNEQEETQGTWTTENDVLVLTGTDGTKADRYLYRILNGQLILRQMTDGGMEIRMSKADAPGTITQPKPFEPDVSVRNSVTGTWFASSMTPNGRLEVVCNIRRDGSYSFQIVAQTPMGSQQLGGQGRWSQQGNVLRFVSETGTEVIPFVVRGDTMILDYSNHGGFVAVVSRQPGKGEIRPVMSRPATAGYEQPMPNLPPAQTPLPDQTNPFGRIPPIPSQGGENIPAFGDNPGDFGDQYRTGYESQDNVDG